MSGEVFVMKTGGFVSLFTVIAVTYPSGSICTCGGKVAKDTSGYALFPVKAGTYTVECHTSDNSKNKSASVTVAESDKGKCKNVTLIYELVLFDNGSYDPVTGGWSRSALSLSATTTSMDGETDTVYTRNKISVSGYSTLHFQVTSISITKNGYVQVGLSSVTDGANFSYVKDVGGSGEVIIPISSASTPLYVRIALEAWPPQNGQYATTSVDVSKVWLT